MKTLIIAILAVWSMAVSFYISDLRGRVRELEATVTKLEKLPHAVREIDRVQKAVIHTIATEVKPAKLGPFLEWRAEEGE
jgi:hypothetical protein